ncbi:hypothetical protein SUGI_0000590 [Cryptomeria japonica]|nr:hypothetical protein SUGI_0000590 [Cryptomeria japonica]
MDRHIVPHEQGSVDMDQLGIRTEALLSFLLSLKWCNQQRQHYRSSAHAIVMGIFCQLCLSIQASALGYTYDLASLCGGLHTRKRNGCSSRTRRIDKISHRSRVAAIHSISVQSKASEAFVQPLKLLPSTPANYSLTTSLEEELHSLSDFSQTLYRVELITSNDSSSDLSDTNAGILVCIIGENGNSIIQRFPAILPTSQVFSSDMSEIVQQNCNRLHFQRGSVDGLTFWGPDIGKLVAIWIGPESGSWRLSRTNEVMLGDGGDSAVELRASRVQEVSGNQEISNGFAIGGTFGFIYLLLLQGAVDKLPGPPSFESQSYPGSAKNNSLFQDNDISRGSRVEKQGQDMDMEYSNLSSLETKKFQDSFSGFRGPLTRLSWIIAILFLTSKYASGKVMITLKPQELLAGAAGFLTCKVAAVMASFRTIAIDCKDHKK